MVIITMAITIEKGYICIAVAGPPALFCSVRAAGCRSTRQVVERQDAGHLCKFPSKLPGQ